MHKKHSITKTSSKALGEVKLNFSSAPPARLADALVLETQGIGALPITVPRRARVVKSILIYAFQSLDALVVAAATVAGCTLASSVSTIDTAFGIVAPFLAMPFLLLWALAAFGAYRFEYGKNLVRRWAKTAITIVGVSVFAVWAAHAAGMPGDAFQLLVLSSILAVSALLSLHVFYSALVKHWSRSGRLSSTVVIVGATENARRLVRQSAACKELDVVAIFDDRASRRPGNVENVPVIGGVKDLLAWDELHTIDKIIITVSSTASRRVNELIDQLRTLPQEVVLFMDIDGYGPEQVRLAEIASAPMAYISGAPRDEVRLFSKRVQDLVFASGMLVVFAPIMALIAVLIRLDSPGPVLFRQKRYGFNNRIIEVLKFRTMRVDSDQGPMQQVKKNDARITRIGAFLRRTSLDELPQLFNVLRGTMSLVGPRPHAVGMCTGEVESWKLVAHYAHRHRVKPGLTGWAQVNGSRGPLENAEQVRNRVRLDIEYIRGANFWLDLWIMLRTGPCLFGDNTTIR